MQKFVLIISLALVFQQQSIAQTVDDKVRVIGAGIGVINKIVESERNDRNERKRWEEEQKREHERQLNEALEIGRQQRREAERQAELEEQAKWDKKIAYQYSCYEAVLASIDAVKAGSKDYREHNRQKQYLYDHGGACFISVTGEVLNMNLSAMDNDRNQLLTIAGDWCYHNNEGTYNYNFIDTHTLTFNNVKVYVKYRNNKTWDILYSGPSTIFLSANSVYSEKLSTAFHTSKPINLGTIDEVQVIFEGGVVNTYR